MNRSEKNGLEVVEGTSDDLYEIFLKLQKEMQDRKQYQPTIDYVEFGEIQKKLPESMKMHIVICKHEGRARDGHDRVCNRGQGHLPARRNGRNGDEAEERLPVAVEDDPVAAREGCRWYDLGGIDPENNPGVYHFKVGMSSVDVSHIGQYEANTSTISSLAVGFAEKFKGSR